jgi:hypothetical protein
MQIDTAIIAGQLAQQIKSRQDKIAFLQNAVANNGQISRLMAVDPSNGSESSLLIETIDAATSSDALQFATQIYQGQLTELQSQLSGL